MIHQVKIKTVNELDLYDGIVQFTINGNEYDAFFYAEKFKVDEYVKVELNHLEYPLVWDIIFGENNKKELKIEKSNDSQCSYYAYGKIIGINPVLADFGDIKLELGNWTTDQNVINEFIYWKIERLDITKLK